MALYESDTTIKWKYLSILALILVAFGNSLKSSFLFDDYPAIVKNPDCDIKKNFLKTKIFKNDFWGMNITSSNSHKSYRPLTILTYRLIRIVSSQIHNSDLNPFYFHLTNLFVYSILCCTLLRTLQVLLSGPLFSISKKDSTSISYLVTVLFTVHPIHCEAVNFNNLHNF